MKVFIAGTDTDVGKTIVASWICLHSGFDYFKPIQTGSIEGTDSTTVSGYTNSKIHNESYVYKAPLSPHVAAAIEADHIEPSQIELPEVSNLVVEGAGGLLVPINSTTTICDLIKLWQLPVILVARTKLGTINHSLLSIEQLRRCGIPLLGVIMVGDPVPSTTQTIRDFGGTEILAEMPFLNPLSKTSLQSLPLPTTLQKALGVLE